MYVTTVAIELLNEPMRAITIQIHWCIVWIDKQLHVSVVLFHSVFQDLEAWYQDVQSRLQLIPDPSYKLQYTPTCTAIQKLQVKCTNCHHNLPSWWPSPCKQPILISAPNCTSADHRQEQLVDRSSNCIVYKVCSSTPFYNRIFLPCSTIVLLGFFLPCSNRGSTRIFSTLLCNSTAIYQGFSKLVDSPYIALHNNQFAGSGHEAPTGVS